MMQAPQKQQVRGLRPLPIVSYQLEAFQEYPDEVSLMVFTRGCNLDCIYCFNKHSMCTESIGEAIDVIDKLINPMHTAVVISGGEPTIHPGGLEDALSYIKKELGLKTKLFSNGVNILTLKTLLDKGLLDALSIDFKTARKVQEYTQARDYLYDDTYLSNIRYLINRCVDLALPLDIRTVLHPDVDYSEVDGLLDDFNAKAAPLITIYKEAYIRPNR